MKENNLLVLPIRIISGDDNVTLAKENGKVLEFKTKTKKPSPIPNNRAAEDIFFQRGLEAEQSGKIDEAVNFYTQAVTANPNAAGALVNLGTIAFHRRNFGEAERYYRRVVEVDPQYALGRYNLGNCLDELSQVEEAIECYREALRINPQYLDAHYNLAIAYQGKGHVQKAYEHWGLYIQYDKSYPPNYWVVRAQRERDTLKRIYGDHLISLVG